LDLPRLKKPFGRLIEGEPDATMPELAKLIKQEAPKRISAVGDVVSRETFARGIPVDLRIIDHKSLRRPTKLLSFKQQKSYSVTNPAGVITSDAWNAIKRAMQEQSVTIIVDGEEDLLTLPCIAESPDDSFVVYGQPKEGLVVADVNPRTKREAKSILERMIQEESV
jgi:GTP-dependent dephospho-CoA kinase